MKKLHVKRFNEDCVLEVELLEKKVDVWDFFYQFSGNGKIPGATQSGKAWLPVDFLKRAIGPELNVELIERSLLEAFEKHADEVNGLPPNGLMGPLEIWVREAKDKISAPEDIVS